MRRALILAAWVGSAGCACGDLRTRDDGRCVPDTTLDGVWTGRLDWTSVNGVAWSSPGPAVARFEPEGDGWAATFQGDDADVTVHDDDPFELRLEQTRVSTGDDRSITDELVLSGTDPYWDGELRLDAQLDEVIVAGGETDRYVVGGEAELHKLEPWGDEADGLAWVAETDAFAHEGFAVNVRVRDGHAYVARYQGGLAVVDVTVPEAPEVVAEAPVVSSGIYNDVKLLDVAGSRYALMASSQDGLVVYDVTDPRAPVLESVWPGDEAVTEYDVHTLVVDDDRDVVYLARIESEDADGRGPGGLDIVDLSDPSAPVWLGGIDAGAWDGRFVHDLFVRDELAYLCAWESGLVIADVDDPENVTVVGRYDDYERRTSHSVWVEPIGDRLVAAHGDEDWDAHLRLLDVTDPASPTLLGEWRTRPEVSLHNVMLLDGRVYAAHYQDGVRIVDATDPTRPEQAAFFNTWSPDDPGAGGSFYEGAVGIDVALGHVWVADSRGLVILREE